LWFSENVWLRGGCGLGEHQLYLNRSNKYIIDIFKVIDKTKVPYKPKVPYDIEALEALVDENPTNTKLSKIVEDYKNNEMDVDDVLIYLHNEKGLLKQYTNLLIEDMYKQLNKYAFVSIGLGVCGSYIIFSGDPNTFSLLRVLVGGGMIVGAMYVFLRGLFPSYNIVLCKIKDLNNKYNEDTKSENNEDTKFEKKSPMVEPNILNEDHPTLQNV